MIRVRGSATHLPFAQRSFQCCVTSPPYWGLRAYGNNQDEMGRKSLDVYVKEISAAAAEVWRVLADDGLFWLNIGDTYSGSGGAGGDYNVGGSKEGRPKWKQGDSGLRPMQASLVPYRVALTLQEQGWLVRQTITWDKCLSGGTQVYARTDVGDGPIMLRDLYRNHWARGRPVELWTGNAWTRVVGVRQTASPGDALEVQLRSGEKLACTREHRWPLEDGRLVEAGDLEVGDVLRRVRLPEPADADQQDGVNDRLMGWLVGAYLANGFREGTRLLIASHVQNQRRAARLREIAGAFHGVYAFRPTSGQACNLVLSGAVVAAVVGQYVGGDSAATKGLLAPVWRRSEKFLAALLEGYLEGDGHQEASRWRLNFCDNPRLVADLRALAARLGWEATFRRYVHSYQGGSRPGFRGEIRVGPAPNARSRWEVVEIRGANARHFYDVAVADSEHLFALASGILTHNCSVRPEDIRHVRRPLFSQELVLMLAKTKKHRFFPEFLPEKGNVWHIRPGTGGVKHLAPFPEEIPKRCILASTLPGDLVLDPFCGSGMTMTVARRHWRHGFGVDLYGRSGS